MAHGAPSDRNFQTLEGTGEIWVSVGRDGGDIAAAGKCVNENALMLSGRRQQQRIKQTPSDRSKSERLCLLNLRQVLHFLQHFGRKLAVDLDQRHGVSARGLAA